MLWLFFSLVLYFLVKYENYGEVIHYIKKKGRLNRKLNVSDGFKSNFSCLINPTRVHIIRQLNNIAFQAIKKVSITQICHLKKEKYNLSIRLFASTSCYSEFKLYEQESNFKNRIKRWRWNFIFNLINGQEFIYSV